MRVVITGAGAVGRHLAGDLATRGHEVTLIEQDPDTLEKSREWAPGVDMLLGDACEPWVLEKANLATTDVRTTVTDERGGYVITNLLPGEPG